MLLAKLPCYAQDQSFLVLKGVIVDDSTGEGLPFATIAYHRNGVNTMSNEHGGFIFKIRQSTAGDSIHVSHIGYKAMTIAILQGNSNHIIVRLHQKPIQLSDIVVSINPIDIIKKAIARIPDNYPTSPYLLDGFYRLTTRYNNRIIGLSEAVFQVFGSDYAINNHQFRLIKSRVDKDWNAFGWNGLTKIKRPEGLVEADLVSRIHKAPVLGDTQMPAHEFSYLGIIDYEGREAYEIGFDQRSDVQKAYYRGTVIIDKETLAFLSITRMLSPRGIKYWELKSRADLIALEHAQMTDTRYSDSIVVTYRPYGGKYYLRHYYRNAGGRLSGGTIKAIDLDPYFTETNYLVTRIDTEDVKPFPDSILMPREAAIEFNGHQNNPRSDKFWENYNLIEASFNVDSVVSDLRRRNLVRPVRP
jgi:CarboxypepD_reg-like domain